MTRWLSAAWPGKPGCVWGICGVKGPLNDPGSDMTRILAPMASPDILVVGIIKTSAVPSSLPASIQMVILACTLCALLKPCTGIADPRSTYTAPLIHRHGREKG